MLGNPLAMGFPQIPDNGIPGTESHGMNMASPSPNYMMAIMFEQIKQSNERFQQQQAQLEQLTETVKDMTQHCFVPAATATTGESDHSGDQCSQYDTISSSESDVEPEPESKRQKVSSGENKLKKLKAMEFQFSQQEEYGPAVNAVVASAVNKGLSEMVDHKSPAVKDMLNKYVRPENCPNLAVPKVNKLLWTSKQTSSDSKQMDKSFQRTQTYLTKGIVPVIQLMNKTLTMESEEAESLFDLALDAFNLLAYAHRDFSGHRRRLLMPAISTRYSSLCHKSKHFRRRHICLGMTKSWREGSRTLMSQKSLAKVSVWCLSVRAQQSNLVRGGAQNHSLPSFGLYHHQTGIFWGKRLWFIEH